MGSTVTHAGHLPVFRCALEEWPAQDYQVIVFHRGPLEGDSHSLFETLKEASLKTGINLAAASADVSEPMSEPAQSLWSAQGDVEAPWMVVTTAGRNGSDLPVWTGQFREEAVNALLDSPARRKLADALLQGDSAVWVLLECGDTMRDEAAVDTLAGSLKELEKKLQLPPSGSVGTSSKSSLSLRVAFSLVRVTRNDPAEETFVNMLLHGERIPPGKPAAFPVFGRGRTLNALAGKHLQGEFIQTACRYITGACSNSVRESKPAKDLLLAAHWDSIFTNAIPSMTQTPTASPSTNATPAREALTENKPSSLPNRTPTATSSGKSFTGTTAVALAVSAFAVLLLWRLRR